MKQLFNFKRLIKKYSVPCELLAESASGSYVGGEWVPGVAAESKMINGGTDCKSAGTAFGGSNPPSPIYIPAKGDSACTYAF